MLIGSERTALIYETFLLHTSAHQLDRRVRMKTSKESWLISILRDIEMYLLNEGIEDALHDCRELLRKVSNGDIDHR